MQPAYRAGDLAKGIAVDKYACSQQRNKAFVRQKWQERIAAHEQGRENEQRGKDRQQNSRLDNLPYNPPLIEAHQAQQKTADAMEQNAVVAECTYNDSKKPCEHGCHRRRLQSAVYLCLGANFVTT